MTTAPSTYLDEKYMRRALQLATFGAGHVSPNPMVGAVIVAPDGTIIGEGFHRKFGEGHAEVNAFRSVKPSDEHLLPVSTIYVTLEPCSHWGKTPPCANLIVEKGIARAVIATRDPNPKVAGRGVAIMQNAGISVSEGILRKEAIILNKRFFTAQILHRPWILLKWAQTAEGKLSNPDGSPLQISSPATSSLMHAQRALCDAIMVGTNTILTDNPSLDTRLWPGDSPRPVIFKSDKITDSIKNSLKIYSRSPIILDPAISLEENMHLLFFEHKITSLMVEGGETLLKSFLSAGLYDCIRCETSYPNP